MFSFPELRIRTTTLKELGSAGNVRGVQAHILHFFFIGARHEPIIVQEALYNFKIIVALPLLGVQY